MTSSLRLLFVDVASKGAAAFWWRGAAAAFKGAFDVVVECRTPDDVYAGLESHAHHIAHAQVWGHGLPGKPLIDGSPLDERNKAWLGARGGSVWFRSCKVPSRYAGRAFMQGVAAWGADVVGHLGLIGGPLLSQSYLVGVRAGEKPWWPSDIAVEGSAPWLPRTVPVTAMSLPSWAFDKGRGV